MSSSRDWIYHKQVPRDVLENLDYRQWVRKRAAESLGNAHQFYMAAARDMLYFINTFCWIFDPNGEGSLRPFVTWEFQDETLPQIDDAIGKYDLSIPKSRDMGASWMCLTAFVWRFLFRSFQTFTMLSRKEDLVDKTENPDTLFWKVDCLLKFLPRWLKPRVPFERTHMHILNPTMNSVIDGESTTADSTVGGRRLAILADEHARFPDGGYPFMRGSRDVSRCRLFVSSAFGVRNAFYDVCRDPARKLIRLHWTVHPMKARGLYYDAKGKPRSPWYDEQCRRATHPMEIAQELDIDFLAADYQFFDPALLQKADETTVKTPAFVGDLIFDDQLNPVELKEHPGGKLKLWVVPDDRMQVPNDEYVVGADIGLGTGASFSALIVTSVAGREQVAEYAWNLLDPNDLADYAVALCKLFNNARLIWEATGPGGMFGKRAFRNWKRVYYDANEKKDPDNPREGDVPGWWSTRYKRGVLLGGLARALKDGTCAFRSQELISDCRMYVFSAVGGALYAQSGREDPAGAGDNHADRVIPAALCCRLMDQPAMAAAAAQEDEPPFGTLAWRRKYNERREERAELARQW